MIGMTLIGMRFRGNGGGFPGWLGQTVHVLKDHACFERSDGNRCANEKPQPEGCGFHFF
jgi:hypothetical protein